MIQKTTTNQEPRKGKDLIRASMPFAQENITTSWIHTLVITFLVSGSFVLNLVYVDLWYAKLGLGILSGLFLIRFFIIYHDYLHFAILKNSKPAKYLMTLYGLIILAPTTIWKRSHDHHHHHNAKLTNSGIGAYPLLAKDDFNNLTKKEKALYLAARHPLTIFFGYITLFVLDFNVKTFILSPKNHFDSAIALIIHITASVCIYTYLGPETYFFGWALPFLVANGAGSYLFYAQHNFPGAKFKASGEWDFAEAAKYSTSYLKTNAVMNWFTGDIGYHHVHHLNHHIPFYRLKEAMDGIPEMQHPIETSFSPKDIWACFRLKIWDPEKGEMTPL